MQDRYFSCSNMSDLVIRTTAKQRIHAKFAEVNRKDIRLQMKFS